MLKPFLIVPFFVITALAFGSDDRFLKKYALIKIFESCFGSDVVKEIRKELKAACAKCAPSDVVLQSTTIKPSITKNQNSQIHKVNDNSDMQNSIFANQQAFPSERLHQAILAFRPNSYPQPSFRPYPGSAASYYQAFANPGSAFYGGNYPPFPTMYPGGTPFNYQYNPYFDSARVSRNMHFKRQLETLSSKTASKMNNITCIMQELGYLDERLEPNYEMIVKRIENLPVPKELKQDIQDGVTYCQQFSQCIPEPKNNASPLTKELSKPMLFFKCYKYKKLEACVMKDVRDKISNFTDDEVDAETALRRNGKSVELDDEEGRAFSSLYDFLYGAEGDLDINNLV